MKILIRIVLMAIVATALVLLYFSATDSQGISVEMTLGFLLLAGCLTAIGHYAYHHKKWLDSGVDLLIATGCALTIFLLYPGEFFDDAGFVMRYLENFHDGHFYAFNPTDGPVMGISSPVQGLVNGMICATGAQVPEQAIRRTAFIGLILLIFCLIRIFRKTNEKGNDFLLFTVLVLISSKYFLGVMKAGLETPMHLAIVMGALLAFYARKERAMWFLLALSVISKLDAVPIVLVIGSAWLIGNFRLLFPIRWSNKHLRDLLLFAVLPVIAWIGLATLVFGSALPQSAYAKLEYHYHASDYWFPFFVRYAKDDFYFPLMIITASCAAVMVVVILFQKKWDKLKLLVPGIAFLATLVLYYFYNPGERMMWYYTLPDLLLILQLMLCVAFLVNLVKIPMVRLGLLLTLAFGHFTFIYRDIADGKVWLEEYMSTVEYERNAIGLYLGYTVPEGDTLMTWHGLTGRYVKGYVADMSGLNSKKVTEYSRNMYILDVFYQPDWVVNTRNDEFIRTFQKPPYTLDTIFYDVTAYGYPEWHIYKRVPEGALHEYPILLSQGNVWSGVFSTDREVNHVSGEEVQLAFKDDHVPLVGFVGGIQKMDTSFTCRVELIINQQLVETKLVRVLRKGRDHPNEPFKVQGFRFDFKTPITPQTEAVVVLKNEGNRFPLVVVDPSCVHRY
ncbi:MAG: hypothetical protein V4604_10700 [Bacteroidota bacterium]